jgi:hypothetical protein
VGHTIFSTLYSVGKLDENGMKNEKMSMWMKTVEMDENVIDECAN